MGYAPRQKNCVKASPREQKRQRAKVVGSADVHLESAYALSVNDVLDAEADWEQSSESAKTLTKNKVNNLWIC